MKKIRLILLSIFLFMMPISLPLAQSNITVNYNDGVFKEITGDDFLPAEAQYRTFFKRSNNDKKSIYYCGDAKKGLPNDGLGTGTYEWSDNCKTIGSGLSKSLSYVYENGYGTYKADGDYSATKYLLGDHLKDYYITQIAVWSFLKPEEIEGFNFEEKKYQGKSNEVVDAISNLVLDAQKAASEGANLAIEPTSSKMTLTSDKKYYVSGSMKLKSRYLSSKVTVSITGNAFITTNKDATSGQTSVSLDGDSTFYVKILSSNVTSSQTFTINASADSYLSDGTITECSYSDSDDVQPLITYNPVPSHLKAEASLTVTKYPVVISKKSTKSNSELPNAKLAIKRSDGVVVDSWTSSSSAHTINLDPGTYTLEETEAPKGYIKNNKTITFTVKDDGSVEIDGKKVTSIVMDNTPILVKISKKSITGNAEIPGAKLKITDKSGKTVNDVQGNPLEWTSTSTPKEIHIAAGTYYLVETEAPKGYIKNDESIAFTVKEDGSVQVDSKKVSSVVMNNEPIMVKISKRSITGSAEIPGAKLKITDKNGKTVNDIEGNPLEWVSVATPREIHIAAGTYYLVETIAPRGYKLLSNKVEFTVDEKGKIKVNGEDVSLVAIVNEPIKVKISKRDITGSEELAGATLEILDKNGKAVKDMNGKELSWVSTDEPKEFWIAAGTYYLSEKIAPKGYELSETIIEFTVTNTGKVLVDGKELEDNLIVYNNIPMPTPTETGDTTFIIIIAIGVIAIGVSAYYILRKYKK